MSPLPVHVIGGGLAGSEAAWQLARRGVPVVLHEMRPVRGTEAHQTDRLAELVCSNSFRSDDAMGNAVGLLHEEMRRLGSLIMAMGDRHKLPAGGALAVDRDGFSAGGDRGAGGGAAGDDRARGGRGAAAGRVGLAIVATGPLTSPALAEDIRRVGGEDQLAFFDAIAPIVHKEIDRPRGRLVPVALRQGGAGRRRGGLHQLPAGPRRSTRRSSTRCWRARRPSSRSGRRRTPYFEGCLPIEVMAERGRETLRFGPMKPVGLTDPRTGRRPHAVVQLRQDNALGTLYNMVGFQTKLKHAEQVRVFRTDPGPGAGASSRGWAACTATPSSTARACSTATLRLKAAPHVRLAGQLTGCEGYVESAAVGPAGRAVRRRRGAGAKRCAPPPPETAHGRPARPHHRRRRRPRPSSR